MVSIEMYWLGDDKSAPDLAPDPRATYALTSKRSTLGHDENPERKSFGRK